MSLFGFVKNPKARNRAYRRLRLAQRFPETASHNLIRNAAALERRRAKNRVAKQTRKRNRPK
jgi:hypothetical protein